MIAEEGTHDELIKLNGLYAGIYNRQLLEQEIEEI
jgi:ABC-type multidrug transport system fused ATPase/permease subunit